MPTVKHPKVLRAEVAAVQFEAASIKARLQEVLKHLDVQHHRCETLTNQLRGGYRGVDPRTEPEHPGHVLIRLGWTFCPEEPDDPDDEIGAYWMDPEEKGTGTHTMRSLPAALSIACRRLLDKACKTRLERLIEDDNG